MNQIGLLEQEQELRGLRQRISFPLRKSARSSQAQEVYFQLLRRVRRLRMVSMTESEKDAEIVRLRERYVELLQLLGEAMHNGYLDENACSPLVDERSAACRHADRRGSRNVPRIMNSERLIKTRPRCILERSVF